MILLPLGGIILNLQADLANATGVLPTANGGTGSATGTWSISGAWAATATGAITLTSGDSFTIAAGGTNKNVVLTPSGTGIVTTAKKMTVTDATAGTGFSTAALVVTGGIAAGDTCFLTNVVAAATGIFQFNGRATIYSPAADKFRLTNPGFSSASTMLLFSLETNAAAAIKRNGATLEVRLADDSGFAAKQSLYERFGSGTPEGNVTAPVGARYSRTDGGAGTSFYVKESGAGNTGWVAK